MEEKENEETEAGQEPTENDPVQEMTKVLEEAKKDFEKRLAETTATLTKKIAERDKIISDLVSGKPQETQEEDFITKINKKREENLKFI